MIVRHPEDEDDKLLCQVIKNQCDIGSVQVGVYTIALRLDVAVLPAAAPGGEDEISAVTGRVFVAKTPERFTYDADGNMTSDGRFTYTWNDENRMVSASNAEVVVTYAYDHRGRMVSKTLCASAPLRLIKSTTYLWDGWNIICEELRTPHAQLRTTHNLWGFDLDGTMQGAPSPQGSAASGGGVPPSQGYGAASGGLLATQVGGAWYFPAYDANGNVTQYVDEGGHVVASYIYDAFGNTVAESGAMADAFPFRFSTKYYDSESGLYYYGYRFYSPKLGRWLTRDPIEEAGGVSLYGFCGNDGVGKVDFLGEDWHVTRRNMTFAEATRDNTHADTISKLAQAIDLDSVDAMGWARKDSSGAKFASMRELESACRFFYS